LTYSISALQAKWRNQALIGGLKKIMGGQLTAHFIANDKIF
jgi:hypothetical protein